MEIFYKNQNANFEINQEEVSLDYYLWKDDKRNLNNYLKTTNLTSKKYICIVVKFKQII